MQPRVPPERELTTWAEIAAYLGVTERTAQTWRKDRGLPVRNAGRRVVCTVAALEEWKRRANESPERTAVARETAPAPAPRSAWRRPRPIAIALAVAAAVATGTFWLVSRPGPPVRFEAHGNVVTAYDDRGRRVWAHTFEHVIDEAWGSDLAASLMTDLNGDGVNELVFIPWRTGRSPALHCFTSDGKVAWRASFGREIRYHKDRRLLADYAPVRLAVLKQNRRDGGRIVVLSRHHVSWPAHIAVLTLEGRQVAEHWHPGWLYDLAAMDIDGDGVEEIVAGGVNNSYLEAGQGAMMIVLDSRFATGQGPVAEGDSRVVRDVPLSGTEASLLFPNLPVIAGAEEFTKVESIRWSGGGLTVRIRFSNTLNTADYQLDRRLRVTNITLSPDLEKLVAGRRGPAMQALERITVLENRFDRN